jgi:hypothetical protein
VSAPWIGCRATYTARTVSGWRWPRTSACTGSLPTCRGPRNCRRSVWAAWVIGGGTRRLSLLAPAQPVQQWRRTIVIYSSRLRGCTTSVQAVRHPRRDEPAARNPTRRSWRGLGWLGRTSSGRVLVRVGTASGCPGTPLVVVAACSAHTGRCRGGSRPAGPPPPTGTGCATHKSTRPVRHASERLDKDRTVATPSLGPRRRQSTQRA